MYQLGIQRLAIPIFCSLLLAACTRKTADYEVESRPEAIATADFDGDGRPDVALATLAAVDSEARNSKPGRVIIFRNVDGELEKSGIYQVGAYPDVVKVADFNGDEKPDLVTGDRRSGTASILMNKGDGTFSDAHQLRRFKHNDRYPGMTSEAIIAVGDFDGDDYSDVVIHGKKSLLMSAGTADGTFEEPRALRSTGCTADHAQLAAARIWSEDRDDLLYNCVPQTSAGPQLRVIQITSDEAADGASKSRINIQRTAGASGNMIVADVIRGELPEVLVSQSDALAVLRATAPDDSGRATAEPFGEPVVSEMSLGLRADVEPIDVDGDGQLDLALTYKDYDNGHAIQILKNQGDGTFKKGHTIARDLTADDLAVADINGDGKPDVVVANRMRHDGNARSMTVVFNAALSDE